ncbi:MAG: hypothetical protein HS104_14790 [Polyangiaceae bacterium]|nr:hypothetical protein [Polyangiaceae bacterium]MCE7890688.1 hypothetical protein [Sorangiineae bacterium PRO1]MCL4748833.1 hypothetical protein [Myxococcales bacterium]
MRAPQVSFVLALLAAARAAPALGASFDPDGSLVFDPAALHIESFESVTDAGPGGEEDPGALDGARVLKLTQYQGVDVPVPLPSKTQAVRVRLWAKGEVVASLETRFGGRVEDFGAFYPTGRVTSDGWYELELHAMSVDVSRVESLAVGLFSPSGADVDAVELAPAGAAVPSAECAGAGDKSACAPGQICMWNRCRDFAARVPALPPPAYRDDLVDYLDQRFALLYGPFENRKLDLPNARLEISSMRTAPDAWSFWRAFRVAIHRLHDWHTRGSDSAGFSIQSPRPIGICFIEGKADVPGAVVSTPGYLDVLVSHVGQTNSFGLKPGDRLVSVDGQHPILWARSLISVDFGYETASNHTTHAEAVQRMNRLISAYADRIEVLRCDAATKTCASAPEEISISSLPYSTGGGGGGASCDNRPVNHVPGGEGHPLGGVFSGIVKESDATERIYGLQWSSLNVGGGGNLGPVLEQAIADFRANARGLILDHRTGFGGTTSGPELFWNLIRTPTPLDVFELRQRADQEPPKSLADGKALFEQLAAAGAVEMAGGIAPDLALPVALLIHLDGSASDWLPLGFKGAPKAKVFGPYQTAGAFSTLLTFGYWFGMGYSIAVGDTLHSSGQMLNGHGVEPDFVVLPLQSDLMDGKDTVYDAALAWVRQGLKP